MYSLGVRRKFKASHYLVGGDWGDENIAHSHQYQIEIVLEKGELDQQDFLVDIVEIERHLDEIVSIFSGKMLNDLKSFEGYNPSIERLATVTHQLLGQRFDGFGLAALKVVLWEDDIAWTSYEAAL